MAYGRPKQINMPVMNGLQKYWQMKMGMKPQLNFQAEQPSGTQVNTTPDYLQDMKTTSKGGK